MRRFPTHGTAKTSVYSSGMSRPETIGALRKSGWESIPVRQELRNNTIERIRSAEPLFSEVIGYDNTVNPQLSNALIAGHDIIFLGERGQAKTRMIRDLTNLLDEWMPIVAGSEINDDPTIPDPASQYPAYPQFSHTHPHDREHPDPNYSAVS